MTEKILPAYPIAGTASGQPASMSVLLEDGMVEIFAPPFFRFGEEEALALADLLVRQFLPLVDYHPGIYGWWRVDESGARWIAPVDAWNPKSDVDDLR